MAGAGKRTFIAGEVLTAAQVNDYLMDQAVMRFSGSAARAASITAPTEGMVTYLDDQNRLEIYDGAAWIIADPRQLITASGQLLIGAATGSLRTVPLGNDGEVLHVDVTASAGVRWKVVEAGGAAVYFQVAASGVTALPSTLTPGFYRISTSTTTSWSDTQWRFVDSDGQRYGATITGGAGFFTIPREVASINVTTASAAPFTVLVEEIIGVTSTLNDPPTVTGATWNDMYTVAASLTAAPGAASIGVFNLGTGQFNNLGTASSQYATASVMDPSFGTIGASYNLAFVQANSSGVWSAASPFLAPYYPFQMFTGNGTFTPLSGISTYDVLIVSGGGGSPAGDTYNGTGGGGAGGASIWTARTVSSPTSVTIGAGGTGGANGVSSSFGALTTTGGGYQTQAGGSGGGGQSSTPAGAGTAGQGNSGGPGRVNGGYPANYQGGGGGGGKATSGSVANPDGGSGSLTWGWTYGGGGGGAGKASSGFTGPALTNGVGGSGGGGNVGSPGTANKGGGAGGSNGAATNGGSGVVVVKVS